MMDQSVERAVAIVGVAAIMPDAPDAATFWQNIKDGRYSITDVTPDRWDPELYFDTDRSAPDKTYSKIGGWVRDFEWNPMGWKLPIPPRVGDAMDDAQKWAINLARAALVDYGYPDRPLDTQRTAVVIGNAMAGEKHYQSALRVNFPEIAREVEASATFATLPADVQAAILDETRDGVRATFPDITEDTMPGELANIIAGRVANVFNFRGPNYVTDAACASGLAAMAASVEGLINAEYDAVLTGGIDRNMGAPTFVKFCKIGALSATGTRPYGEGADGFVMGEGGTLFLLRRLEDAERDGDRIYAVLLAMAGSSDGKGKGITAPNPVGQKLAVERAWELAGYSPATCSLVEGHGTSTAVGDVVEAEALGDVFGREGVPVGSIPLGSVKSNIGHLKGAAGTAGVFKTVMALHEKVLPPSIHAERPNPNIDFSRLPFKVNGELRDWPMPEVGIRRAGVSAFGFGGTNFHAVLEEYEPGRHRSGAKITAASFEAPGESSQETDAEEEPAAEATVAAPVAAVAGKPPLRGIVVVGAADDAALAAGLREVAEAAAGGSAPPPAPPSPDDLKAPVRVAIDYGDAAELATKADRAAKAVETGNQAMWRALRAQGVFMGRGGPGKVAFLYTGQGSQYVNMLHDLRRLEPIVADTFAEADVVMTPLLGKPLTDYIFIDADDPDAVAQLELQLLQTEITQPAVLATDLGLTRLLAAYGIKPDMVMGHSLGEYGALVAAGALTFDAALEAVSARGSEMAHIEVEDNGAMAAVLAPLAEIERIVADAEGYAVIANVNSNNQAVIGGATVAVEQAVAAFTEAGHTAIRLPVSHAFHTSIVAPASEPLRQALIRLDLKPPVLPIVANVDGELYPTGDGPDVVEQMLDILARQVASPVQFVKGLHTLYDEGARNFVELGPKKALHGFVEDVLGQEHDDVVALFTNHPKQGDVVSFNQALSGLYAAGLGTGETMEEVQERPVPTPADRVVITGASIGLAGTDEVFDDANIARILSGEVFIGPIPTPIREEMANRNITRLVKSEAGNHRFEVIDSVDDVIKLAARAGHYDVVEDFGIDPERNRALADYTRLAVGAGFDALRDAGIPLVMHYKTTTLGTKLPERWALPDSMRDTGVIFASAFPGLEEFAKDQERHLANRFRRQQLDDLRAIRQRVGRGEAAMDIDQRIGELEVAIEKERYELDRRYLFRILSMGHAQFAEIIGARGPNTQINSACASTTQGIAIAEDWIRAGRCRRVVVISAENATSDFLLPWVGGGFLASGAAATDERVEDAALPFDNRRHGMLLGMGATGIVVESAEAAAARGMQPIAEVLSTVTANSAFHGTKLDIDHISGVMEELVTKAEATHGVDRHAMADEMIFMSHETYTPARGGSASAEITALRRVFGDSADKIVIANAKGQTGHTLTVGVEDVLALKALETGVVPPVANFKEVDPTLGPLNLAAGGDYPVRFALHLAAGFGSQISMDLFQWTPVADGVRRRPDQLGYEYRRVEPAWSHWLTAISDQDDASLEVVQRRLRVVDVGAAAVAKAVDEPEELTPPGQPVLEPDTAVAPVLVAEPEPQPEPEPAPLDVSNVDVAAEVLALVADKTGYPADMLDPDLDLEADLGIDTVKQAEVFATIRERFGIERDDTIKLRDYPTLGHVIAFVNSRTGGAVEAEPAPEPEPEPAPALVGGRDVAAEVLALVADKTGYPADMLDPDLDLEADLGIDTVKQAEVFATIRESFGIERDDTIKLRDYPTLGHVIDFVTVRTGGAVEPAAEAQPEPEPEPAPALVGGRDVGAEVIALVADKTGYPADMLDPDLDLEADLGIDTVKQAEVFATIRESFGIERDDTIKLRDYPTLGHVIAFVIARSGGAVEPAVEAEPEPVVEAKAEPAPEPEPEPVAAPVAPDRDVAAEVIALVADKTGYPADMLDPELDLEADLGIDTVKQAEVFATIRESFGIERDDTIKLRDYPTLGHVIAFVNSRTGGAAATPEVEPAVEAREIREEPPQVAEVAEAPKAAPREVPSTAAADGVPRRVPVPTIRPALAACAPTGVKLKKGRRVVVGLDRGGVGAKLADTLEGRGVEVLRIKKAPDADSLVEKLAAFVEAGPVHGVYWLKALDHEGSVDDMDLAEWQEANRVRVKLLYTTMRHLYEQIDGAGTFLVSATRLGGRHGYDQAGAFAPLGGAVTGFTKAFAREKPNALVKAVDVAGDAEEAHVVEILIDETLHDPGAVEVGHADLLRWTVTLEELPAANGGQGMVLGPDTVFVVTGAAGSIVSAITADLAGASGGVFHLLDLTPTPDPDDADIKKFATDREGLKTDIIARLKEAGERPTPVMVEKQLAGLERLAAAQAAIDAVHDAGGQAYYHSADIRDGEAVAAIVKDIADRHGKIDVLLHAAGLEISRFLPDKEPGEYDLVFGVKSDGWFNLLHAIGDLPLGATVGFSSVAGRFGNGGQTDYSAANDLLCKLASGMRRTRPDTRAIVIDWTAWGGIGMATRGSIPKMMEMAGIEMLPKDVGIPTIRRELTAGSTRGELVVAGKLGILVDERAELGGVDPTHFETSLAGPMVGRVVKMGVYGGLEVETTLDPKEQPFLDDHRIEGTPVLPGVMGVEAFAEVAQLPLPGWHVVAVEDVDFPAPFKFYRDEPRAVTVTAVYHSEGDELIADCRLTGSRQLPNQPEPQVTEHFTGRVRLAKGRVPSEPADPPPPSDGAAAAGADSIYAVYFHGPAYQVLDRAWRDGNRAVGLYSDTLPADHQPAGRTELASPRLIELFFQTAGMWEIGRANRFALPRHIDRVVLYGARDTLEESGNRAVAIVEDRETGFGGRLVDSAGNVLLEVHGYRTVELPGGVDPDKRVPLAAAMA
jgi:acyl transferase domain-containing protein/acyl carrier protein